MTSTVERLSGAVGGRGPAGAHPGGGSGAGSVVPSPPRARRRWGLFAAMVALVCAGALGVAWLVQASTTAVPVVAARSTIERGTLISAGDLMVVRIATDPSLRTVPGSQLSGLVGKRAALDVAAGSLLTSESVSAANTPGAGFSLVGVGVADSMMPGTSLLAGDRVRVVATADGQAAATGGPTSIGAQVVGTRTGTNASGQSQTIITVSVPASDAAALAAIAASGKVAVVLDSRDR